MSDSNNQAVRILVIDRDLDVGQTIRDALRGEGFACEHCHRAAAGLIDARRHLPSLMIIDTELGACSGFDFARSVREEYPQHEIPVIFVSETRSAHVLEQSRHAGGIYFLSKPIDPAVLVELVDKALWMPHLIRHHIDVAGHPSMPKAPRVLSERSAPRSFQPQ